jgi:LysR family glycine cleavage system transcriptional activator
MRSLQAFEAAARHRSSTAAAEELHVTQSAVSQQVRLLEESLRCELFARTQRGLVLTEEGRRFLPVAQDVLVRLSAGLDGMAKPQNEDCLVLSVLSSFASKWLVPGLTRFRRLCPDIEISLYPSPVLPDFEAGAADAAILWCETAPEGLACHRFLEEEVFPVCAPDLAAGDPPIAEPLDLARHTLLRSATHDHWSVWLAAAGVAELDRLRGLIFDDASMMIEAAVDGLGVGLARGALAADDLAAGRLVRPFALGLPSPFAYHLVHPRRGETHPAVAAFTQWLLAEAGFQTTPSAASQA